MKSFKVFHANSWVYSNDCITPCFQALKAPFPPIQLLPEADTNLFVIIKSLNPTNIFSFHKDSPFLSETIINPVFNNNYYLLCITIK